MKLTTKGRYGTRLMLDLAIHGKNGPVLLREISERQEISEKYLWQLIAPLKNAGLVSSHRGSNGGYELVKEPDEITLYEIITILEGPLSLVECIDDEASCQRSDRCVTKDIWGDISKRIAQMLQGITLKDMVEKYQLKSDVLFYSI